MQKRKTAALAAAVLAGAGGMVLLQGLRSVQSAPTHTRAASGWQTYKDAKLGFLVAKPAGWTVRADDHAIVVQNPSHSETVLAEGFMAAPDESAEAALSRLAQEQATLFPNAQVSMVMPQRSRGDAVSATVSFGDGMGQGRALCSVINGKGLLFVVAAPGGKFTADQPVLTHIVKSLRFMAPAASGAQMKGASAGMAAAVHGLHFVSWTEPREHGFSVDVPAGWIADGGVFHTGPGDLRIAYDVTSRGKDMQVVIGDPRLPSTLVTPNEMLGAREGVNGCSHYMQAPEFNHWYLTNLLRPAMDNLVIGADHPLPEVSRQKTDMTQRQFGDSMEVEVSVGMTEFSGISKMTHKPIIGILVGSTQRMTSRGYGPPTTTWVPTTIMLTCNDDAAKARNQQIVMAVFGRIQRSYHEDPTWANHLAQEGAASGDQARQDMEQNTQQAIDRSQQRSAQITRNSDDARSTSMGAYWGHVNADNERQRGFANYIGGRTDVSGEGETTNVESGSSHYSRNNRTGTVVGTDSADSPGVDFTPLTER